LKVLYLTQVYEAAGDPGSDRHHFLCKYLVARGHRVTAITSNVDYKRAIPKYRGTGWRVRMNIEGVGVSYVYSYPYFRGSFLKRFVYFLTYFLSTLVAGAMEQRVDLVYAVSTPLTVGLLGYLVSRTHGCPFVFEVTDVWPDAAVAMGVVRNKMLIRAAERLEGFCYRKATRVVGLTRGILENIAGKGVPRSKLHLATNGVDRTLFKEPPDLEHEAGLLRAKMGLSGSFACMYLGAHGRYNALGTIIEAAAALRNDRRFVFLLVGDGDEKQVLEAAVRDGRLENVRFLPPSRRSEAPRMLRCADCLLLPNRKGKFFTMNLPNKLFDFLASARPIVVAGEGETATVVREAGAGFTVAAEDGAAMAEAILAVAELEPARREAMGASGRRYVLENYDREAICRKLATCLEGCV
jgi:glycosyltransferase involved in cell wall biosynthesis